MYVVAWDQLVNIYAILSRGMPCISHSELEFFFKYTHTPKSIQTRLKARIYTEKNQVTREIFHDISFKYRYIISKYSITSKKLNLSLLSL